jgi:glycosyltransferase involved in cell wall biosynthesis
MKLPYVSVIIPNYNYARYLPQALDSVLAQTYPHLEIMVVDDGSTDESQALLRNYGEQIRWFQHHRQGVSAARNRGVKESSGELVAFLDADDVWLPTKLERQVQKFLEDRDLGLVHCGWEAIDKTGVPLDSHLDGLEGWVAKELLLLRRPAVLVVGSGAVVPRNTFEEIGGFDARLSTSADWDFSYRVAVRQRVGFVPDVLLQYRLHGTNMHANILVMEHDTLLAFSKAFSSGSREIQQLRRESYGNLHMILAGSFFRAGQKADFARHALKSLWLTPGNLRRLLGFPLRRYWKTETRS